MAYGRSPAHGAGLLQNVAWPAADARCSCSAWAGVMQAAAGAALTDAQRAGLQELYAAMAAEHPKSSACKRIPLDFLQVRGLCDL